MFGGLNNPVVVQSVRISGVQNGFVVEMGGRTFVWHDLDTVIEQITDYIEGGTEK